MNPRYPVDLKSLSKTGSEKFVLSPHHKEKFRNFLAKCLNYGNLKAFDFV